MIACVSSIAFDRPARRRERRAVLGAGLYAGALLFRPVRAWSQQPNRTVRIGVLASGSTDATERRYIDPLRAGLRERGWVEGRNLAFVARYGEGPRHLPALAAELVAAKVDLIVATGTLSAVAASDATKLIPIVFVSASDPVEEGLVASMARPGGNSTGIAVNSQAVLPKRLELLKEALPKLERVAFLSIIDDPSCQTSWERLREPARVLGIRMQKVEIDAGRDYAAAFSAMSRGGAEAVIAPSTILHFGDLQRIGALAASRQLPLVQQGGEATDGHSLFSYGPSVVDAFARAAVYVDRILRGANPATLPIEQPTRYELTLNMKMARTLGISFPRALLARADMVLE